MRTMLPPLLPDNWSSAYISYWQPMKPDDQLTSGYCWFDYRRNICRIDGLFNPWSERETGYRLWMTEIGNAATRRTLKRKIAYARENTADGNVLLGSPLADEQTPFHELFLPQSVLRDHHATHIGRHEVLGRQADGWSFERPDTGRSTFYFRAGTDLLLRMASDNALCTSIRDFPNLSKAPIPDDIFATD
jgi:violacein biosynthesis protein VioE